MIRKSLIGCIGLLVAIVYVSAATSTTVADEVYSWKDESGRLVFGNNPPAQSEEKKKVEAELSRYSTEQVFERYGLTARAALSNKETVGEEESVLPASASARLIHSEVDLDYDTENRITICSVEVTNQGDKTGTEVAVSFEFNDGSLIPADGPAELAPGESSVYFIPESQLPITIEQAPHKSELDPAAQQTTKPIPKVVIQFS
jgi:hypothetical protein